MSARLERLGWLVRRIGRMPAAEWAWRAGSVVRIAARRAGIGSAQRAPAHSADASWGPAWCRVGPVGAPSDGAARLAADRLLRNGPAVFGCSVPQRDGVPDWQCDPATGRRLPGGFGLGIDFRHLGAGIDIKHAWELARHEWWVTLAQAWSVSRDRRYLDRLAILIDDWCERCPYPLGIHWSSAIEHGVRLINWSLAWHMAGGKGSPMFDGPEGRARLERWLLQIYQHVRFIHDNLSRHTSSSNHLLGELAGIAVAVQTWNLWADLRPLAAQARRELDREMFLQFAPDGVNREQALSYHKFSLQFVLAAGLALEGSAQAFDPHWWGRLYDAVAFLAAVIDASGAHPRIGDSDDADAWRLCHQLRDGYHELLVFAAAHSGRQDLLGKCRALELDPVAADVLARAEATAVPGGERCASDLPTAFPEGGYFILGARLHRADEWRVLVDCGALGYNRICAHGHADALALQLTVSGQPILVDPGTYCYNLAADWRRHFRGTAAHNTACVDGRDQSDYGGSFLWLRDVRCNVVERAAQQGRQVLQAWHDGYMRLADPVRHCRRVVVEQDDTTSVEDWLECRQVHHLSLTWQADAGIQVSPLPGQPLAWVLTGARAAVQLEVVGPPGLQGQLACGAQHPPAGWVSTAFYDKQPAPAIRVSGTIGPGERVVTRIRPLPASGGAMRIKASPD